MFKQCTEKFFFNVQTIIFKSIGSHIRTNALRIIMDPLFIVFEKIGKNFDFLASGYLRMYENLVSQEISLAKITDHDRVLVIGCGSLPATAALIAMRCHASVVGIDRDPQAISQATQYVHQLHIEKNITLELADGFAYPVHQFSVIFVLYGVKPQHQLLEYLSSQMESNTRLIFRMVTDRDGKILDPRINISKEFHVKGRVHSDTFGSVDSFLLIKK